MKEKFFRRDFVDKILSFLRHRAWRGSLASRQIHPEDNAIHGSVEGTISLEMGGPVRGVSFAASDNLQRLSHPAKPAFPRTKRR